MLMNFKQPDYLRHAEPALAHPAADLETQFAAKFCRW